MDSAKLPSDEGGSKPHGNRWKGRRNAEILALAETGLTQAEIGRRFGLCGQTIQGILVRSGYEAPPRPVAPDGLEWRVVPFAPAYEVSERGDVRCLVRRGPLKAGDLLKQRRDWQGYKITGLSTPDRVVHIGIHRLVAIAFLGDPPAGQPFAAHRDGDRDNNHRSNIYWATPAQNTQDGYDNGCSPKGEKKKLAKLNGPAVLAMRAARAGGESFASIAARYKVSPSTAADAIKGVSWRHIGGPGEPRGGGL